ncbi:MAG: ABC transporter transmembrane domain-containing protein [Hyphomicrobiaceae bacterium]
MSAVPPTSGARFKALLARRVKLDRYRAVLRVGKARLRAYGDALMAEGLPRASIAMRRLLRTTRKGMRRLGLGAAGQSHAGPTLMAWIWQESRREQMPILAIIVCSLPFYYLLFDLPKHIINGPIQGSGFASTEATRPLGQLVPLFAPLTSLASIELDRVMALLVLSALFAALIIVNGAFKLVINTAKGRLGERMLQRLRSDLFARVLAMPPREARRLSGSETAAIIKDEVEPLGGFIGDAFVMPALLVAKALTAALFILLQSVWLGAVAIVIVVVQALIVPRMRRRLIVLGRERQATARALAGRVGEVVEGIAEVHTNNAKMLEQRDIQSRLERIFTIRYEIYQRKFAIKFINNLLAEVPTLIFFLLGGLLVLKGQVDVGQLVAVIVAYGELPDPIKQLIDWDYQRQDMMVRFDQVNQYLPPPTLAKRDLPHTILPVARVRQALPLKILDLNVEIEASGERLRDTSLEIRTGEQVCATGDAGSGANALALALIGDAALSSGTMLCAGKPYGPAGLLGGRLAYVGEDPYVQQGPIRDALLYGLSEEAGAASHVGRLGEILKLVGLEEDILAIALGGRITQAARADVARAAVAARHALARGPAYEDLARVVVRHNPNRYNDEATIGVNLSIAGDQYDSADARWLGRAEVDHELAHHDLNHRLESIGRVMARTAVDLYGGLAHDNVLRLTQRHVPPDEFERYRALIERYDDGRAEPLSDADRRALQSLALGYVESRHRLGLIDNALRERVVAVRQALYGTDRVPTDDADYFDGMTLEQNIIFGSVVHELAGSERQVREAVRKTLADLGSLELVLSLGLAFEAGPGGRRLTLAQRQKIGLARALLRDCELLVANRALSSLPVRSQDTIIRGVLAELRTRNAGAGGASFWVLANAASAPHFDRVLAFAGGQIRDDTRPRPAQDQGSDDAVKGHET